MYIYICIYEIWNIIYIYIWYMIYDILSMNHDLWYVIYDIWYMICIICIYIYIYIHNHIYVCVSIGKKTNHCRKVAGWWIPSSAILSNLWAAQLWTQSHMRLSYKGIPHDTPIAGWFTMENPANNMIRGTPIWGHLQSMILLYVHVVWSSIQSWGSFYVYI